MNDIPAKIALIRNQSPYIPRTLCLFALGGHYREAYQALRARLRGERFALERGQLTGELGRDRSIKNYQLFSHNTP